MLFLWQNNAWPVLLLFGLIVSLVRLIIAAVERIFPLVLIAPLQVCSSSFHTINSLNCFIAVPLVLCDSRALCIACF